MSDDMMFNVMNNDGEVTTTLDRAGAVSMAKELSSGDNSTEVKVESTDKMDSMTFYGGQLEIYVTETRDKRSSRPRRERDDSKGEGLEDVDGEENESIEEGAEA